MAPQPARPKTGVPYAMNPLWDAAQAALALALECLDENCTDYSRQNVDTSPPVADCSSLTVVIGQARAHSGSCVGRVQLSANLDITLIRCCEPVGELNSGGGYEPPSPAEVEAAAACILRDAWLIYNCIACEACGTIGSIQGVTACCDASTASPEILWGSPSGGCRSAIIRVPVVFSTCCVE